MSSRHFKILSLNLHCLEDSWKKRFDHICELIAKNDVDVCSFQEVCEFENDNATDYLLQKLSELGYPVNSFCKRFSHMAWNKYRENLLIISKHHTEDIRDADLPHSPFQRVYVSLKILGHWFVNTHLEFQEEWHDYRKNQIEFLTREWKGENALLMGDFNSYKDAEEQTPFKNANFFPLFPGKSFPSDNPQTMIDGFWLSNTVHHNNPNASGELIFKEKTKDNLYPSDHLGIYLPDLKIRN